MLKKIIGIKNVGRFAGCGSHGNVEFQQKTYLFGENARGKSTLCAILRSLQSGDGAIIEGRKRLGQPDSPEVSLRLDGRNAVYRNGGWDAPYGDLMVFDNAFVHENVYAGDVVDHAHKRNLHRVIVGRHGVTLAKAVEQLDSQSREAAQDLTTKRNALNFLVPRGMALPAFLALQADAEVPNRIAAQEQALAAATQAATRANEIRAQNGLAVVTLPALPVEEGVLAALLATEVAEIARTGQEQVRSHLAHHTRGGREAWVAEGHRTQHENDCPYCGQDVSQVPLVQAYSVLFGEAYAGLQRQATTAQADLRRQLNNNALRAVENVFTENERLNEFWRPLVGQDVPGTLLATEVQTSLEEWREAVDDLLVAKLAAPFEQRALSPRYIAARDRCVALGPRVEAYNAAVAAANQTIEAFKARAPAADVAAARTALEALRAVATRHEAATVAAATAFQTAEAAKTRIEGEKNVAKVALDTHSEQVFTQYQARINELLGRFNTGFRISHTNVSYAGGRPSSTFHVLINNVHVPLGDGSTPDNTACFRNTLSAGDRSALAFAFFVAQAERDLGLANLTLVFDDPYTSQDRSRQTCTQQIITRLATQAKQVIVLSHNPHFLRLLWENSDAATTKLLQFGPSLPNTSIMEWDVVAETEGQYEKDFRTIRAFVNDGAGDLRLVARTMRVLLETYLRLRFIGQFPAGEWLGDFIGRIRNAPAGSPLAHAQPLLPELTDINDFAKRYHHSNPNADAEPIDQAELQGFATRTLAVMGGI
jgi:wobble nucleotide-excising tRNase